MASTAAGVAWGEGEQDPYRRVQAIMEASIARQREAVRRQAERAAAQRPDEFMTPWTPWETEFPGETPDAECSPIPPHQLKDYIDEVARREGFTPDLLRAVIDRESGFNPCAVSSKGAQGLMQLMPETAAELGIVNPFDPHENIAGGARFLSQLLDRYGGDIRLALAAYNAGPARVDRFQGLPPIPETLNYVGEILRKLSEPGR